MDTQPHASRRIDVVIAAAMAATMAVVALVTGSATVFVRVGGVFAATGLFALAARRRRPFAVAAIVSAVVVVEVVPAPEGSLAPAFLAVMIASYSLGAYARRLGLVAGVATGSAGVAVAQFLAPPSGYSHASAISFFAGVLVLAPAAVGRLVRARRTLADRVRASTRTLQAQAADRIAAERAQQQSRVGVDVETVVLSGLERMRPHAAVRGLDDVIALRDFGRDMLGRLRVLLGELRPDDRGFDEQWSPVRALPELRNQVRHVLAAGEPASPPPSRWMPLSTARLDMLLSVIAGVYALLVVAASVDAPRPVASCVLGVVAVAPIAAVRRRPLTAATVSAGASIAFTWVAMPADPLDGWVIGAPLIALPLLVGAVATTRMALAGFGCCLAATVLAGVADRRGTASWGDLVSSVALAAGCWIAGRILYAAAGSLAHDAQSAAAEHERHLEAVREALREDRARVARDLHDAVGHAMTGIVLQATAAARVWDTDPALAREHVGALRATVVEILDDLQPLVASVAIDGGQSPGLAGVSALVERARGCGLRPSIMIEGAAADVDPTRDAIAYRVIQEALTNASRHAPGAHVTLRIVHDDRAITVEVDNDPSPYPAGEPAGSGHGLQGMAERVTGCGGMLEAGPRTDGGFRVRAALPHPAVREVGTWAT